MPEEREWAEFLDRLVHDLREPLRSIHAFSELLSENRADPAGGDSEEAIGQILSGTTRIRTLVDGISGYTLALRERAEPVEAKASSQLAFDLTLDALDNSIRACGATVTADPLPRVAVSLERLMQLLENLVGNSLKFRGEAPPEVHVSAQSGEDGCTFEVRDNGIGIDPADCERVFEPFARIHGRKFPGAGLGLAMCRKIVEAHGGEIRIRPRAEGGSVCTFRLPAA